MAWVFQELTSKIIAAAIEVHKHLGPGLLEIAYQTCLAAELEDRRLKYQREVVVPLTYKNRKTRLWIQSRFSHRKRRHRRIEISRNSTTCSRISNP